MSKHAKVWLVVAALVSGCDLPPTLKTVDTNTGGTARTPKDITIALRHALSVGDPFWVFENTELENESIAGALYSKDLKFTLSAQSNGEQSVTLRDSVGYVTVAVRGSSWGRYLGGTPAGAFEAFPENRYTYNDRLQKDHYYYLHIGSGQDNLGRSDTMLTQSGGGTSLKVPLRELYLQRVRDIVARSQRDQYINNTTVRGYRCIEDSEGYPYVVNLRWGGGLVVEVWDPFLFAPDVLAKLERREIDPLSAKPLAAFDVDWKKPAGTTSTPVDFSALRRRVYGKDGERDSLHFTCRGEEKWFLDGGLNTPHRRAYEHLRKGWEHQSANRRELAVVEYGKALELDPALANASLNRAICSSDNFYGSYSLANLPVKVVRRMINDFTQAMDLSPGRYRTADTLAKRAMCRLAAKDLAGAEADYSEVIRLQPANTSAYRERRGVRLQLGNSDGVASDDVEIARLEGEEKRKAEENKRESIRKAEEARRDVADRLLVEAGMAKWPYEDSTYVQIIPPYTHKVELFKRRLKDVGEKPIVIQLAGAHAEGNSYKFDQLGFKVLKGKKVDSEEKIHLIIEAESDSSGEVKNGQGRVIESLGYGKSVIDRAYNVMLILYLKHKLDWGSEKYSEIATYWDKAEQKVREKDEGAAVEALDEIVRLDPEDRTASNRKMELLEASKNWAGIAAECTRLLQLKPEDGDLRRRRLRAYDELKDAKGQIEDLGWLAENSKEDYYKKDFLTRKAQALARSAAWKDAADAYGAITEKWPGDWTAYDRRVECFLNLGEPERADQARAKSLELQRAVAMEAVSVHEGIATWAEKSIAVVVRPEFRARHVLSSIRLRDSAPVLLYYLGPPALGGELEKLGLHVETDQPSRYDVALDATGDDLKLSLPGGQVLGVIRGGGYYKKDYALAALRAFSTRGRLPILGKAYEDLLPVYEDLLAALDAGDEAKELALRQRLAEAIPGHYELQMEYLLALQRAEDWPRVIELGTRIASMEGPLLESLRMRTQVNYSIAIDPVEGGLKAAIAARLKLGQAREALVEVDAWIARGVDVAAALKQKVELLKSLGEFRAAAEANGALGDLRMKQATSEYQQGYALNEYLAQSDLLKLAGDEPKAREVTRKAMMVTLKDPGTLSSRATERARRGDFPGAMADINDAIERQGEKVGAGSYAARAQLRLLRGDTEGALQDYAAALRITKDAEYYKQRAALFERQGKTAEAAAELKLAWALPIPYPSYYSSRAKERARAGDGGGALDDHAKAISLADNAQERATRLAERAETRRLLKDTAGALEDFGKAAETTKDRAEIVKLVTARAEIRRTSGDFAGAIQELGRAIDHAPDVRGRADLLERRAQLKAVAGDSKGAIDDFNDAVGADESWTRVVRRASLHRRLGDAARAADDIRFALTLPFKSTEYYSFAYGLKMAGAPPAVWLEVFDKASRMLPPSKQGTLLLNRAGLLLSADDLAAAEKDYDAAVKADARADILMARARLRRQKGDLDGMRADLAAACSRPVDATSYGYWTSRALSRFYLDDVDGAFKDVEEAIRRYPAESGVRVSLAEFQARAGRFDEALVNAEKALAMNKSDYWTSRVYAQLLAFRGRKEEAHRAFSSYPYKDSDSYWEFKVQLEMLAGDLDGAIKLCESALETYPSSQSLRARLAELRLAQGDPDGALKQADILRSVDFQDWAAFQVRGLALARKRDPKAQDLMALASALSMTSLRLEMLAATGKPDEALKGAKKAAADAPKAAFAQLLLAEISLEKGDRKAAADHIKAGLERCGLGDGLTRIRLQLAAKKAQE